MAKKDKEKGFQIDQSLSLKERRALGSKAAADAILKKYGKNAIDKGNAERFSTARRFPSGIFMLDYALNGGWPRGRVNSIWGDKSSFKTTNMLKMIANAQKMDLMTNKFIWDLNEEEKENFIPFRVTYLDVEGAYDPSWAKRLGIDIDSPNFEVARPQTSEQAADMGQAILESGSCDILVVDSIAAMAPKDEVEASQEDWQQGLAARLNNKMFRKMNHSQNKLNQMDEGVATPTVFLINQERLKIGVMFGDPRVKPGGKGQDFITSAEVHCWGGQVEYFDKEKKLPKSTRFAFKVKKLKVGPVGIEGEADMAIADDPDGLFKMGDFLEDKIVLDFAGRVGLLKEVKGGWEMYGETFKKKGDLIEKYIKDADRFITLKRDVLKILCPNQ